MTTINAVFTFCKLESTRAVRVTFENPEMVLVVLYAQSLILNIGMHISFLAQALFRLENGLKQRCDNDDALWVKWERWKGDTTCTSKYVDILRTVQFAALFVHLIEELVLKELLKTIGKESKENFWLPKVHCAISAHTYTKNETRTTYIVECFHKVDPVRSLFAMWLLMLYSKTHRSTKMRNYNWAAFKKRLSFWSISGHNKVCFYQHGTFLMNKQNGQSSTEMIVDWEGCRSVKVLQSFDRIPCLSSALIV